MQDLTPFYDPILFLTCLFANILTTPVGLPEDTLAPEGRGGGRGYEVPRVESQLFLEIRKGSLPQLAKKDVG